MSQDKVFRVLSIDGGGMRGYYSAAYLFELEQLAKKRLGNDAFKFDKQFHMIVGTSTGAILGAGIANGLTTNQIMALYSSHGKKIFPERLPSSKACLIIHNRSSVNAKGEDALRRALTETFGELTLGQLYKNTGIAMVVPAVNATTNRGWAFKTPHNVDTNHRDDDYSLVDVCLASSAAPIYRSLAAVKQPGHSNTVDLFADGGLWANNPVLVALSEALRVAPENVPIEIFCLGTSPAIAGEVLNSQEPHWGLREWKFGGRALEMSLDAQAGISDYIAKSLISHLKVPVKITRFPQRPPSASQSEKLGLDNSSIESLDIMRQLAKGAADDTNILISGNGSDGANIKSLLSPLKSLDIQHQKGEVL